MIISCVSDQPERLACHVTLTLPSMSAPSAASQRGGARDSSRLSAAQLIGSQKIVYCLYSAYVDHSLSGSMGLSCFITISCYNCYLYLCLYPAPFVCPPHPLQCLAVLTYRSHRTLCAKSGRCYSRSPNVQLVWTLRARLPLCPPPARGSVCRSDIYRSRVYMSPVVTFKSPKYL